MAGCVRLGGIAAGLAGVALLVPAARGTGVAATPAQAVTGNGDSQAPAVSAGGRFVAFDSFASNLVDGDTNKAADVFVRDRLAGTTDRVSVGVGGEEANAGSGYAAISANGRFVAFASSASNLVAGDTNEVDDVFVRDRLRNTTQRLSLGSGGGQGDGDSGVYGVAISADGRFVAFDSEASSLVAHDTLQCADEQSKYEEYHYCADVFVRDRLAGRTERVSLSSAGRQARGESWAPAISGDGRIVVFSSNALGLVPGRVNGKRQVFVRDRAARTTTIVSVSSAGRPGDFLIGEREAGPAAVSADGRFVAFSSDASNLVPGDKNNTDDVFLRDRRRRTTTRLSLSRQGGLSPAISARGRFVAFDSVVPIFVEGEEDNVEETFVRDRAAAMTEMVSLSSHGEKANAHSGLPAISADGRYVAFQSWASNLVDGDVTTCYDEFSFGYRNCGDIFLRDRTTGTTTLISVGR